jgi:hypothetical protein
VIPAILAAPLVQGVVGGVVNGVMTMFSPSGRAPTSGSTAASFNPYLDRAATTPPSPPVSSSTGTMRSGDWNQMSSTDVQSWAKGLAGKHVDATDESGRTISGQVGGMQMLGNNLALNIGGHLVSLSQLKQISWSPSAV